MGLFIGHWGDLARFRAELARVLGLLRGTDAYILGDFNVDLLGLDRHGPTNSIQECVKIDFFML